MINRIETRPASLSVLRDLAYSSYPQLAEQRLNIESYERVNSLLEDLGLNPDRKYSVEEISRMRFGIEWALGGER